MVTNSGFKLTQQSSIISVSQNSEQNIRRTEFRFFQAHDANINIFVARNRTEFHLPPPSLPTEPHYKMCLQKQFLDNTQQYNQQHRTNMGPNNRIEAVLDIERDILDSLKKLSKFTTEMTAKKLQAMYVL